MLQHGPRSAPPYLRPLKKKGFKEERVTAIRLYDMGKSTTLESNKSLLKFWEGKDRNAVWWKKSADATLLKSLEFTTCSIQLWGQFESGASS